MSRGFGFARQTHVETTTRTTHTAMSLSGVVIAGVVGMVLLFTLGGSVTMSGLAGLFNIALAILGLIGAIVALGLIWTFVHVVRGLRQTNVIEMTYDHRGRVIPVSEHTLGKGSSAELERAHNGDLTGYERGRLSAFEEMFEEWKKGK